MKLCSIAAVHTSIRIQEDASIGEKANTGKVGSKARSEGKFGKVEVRDSISQLFFAFRMQL